MAFRKSLLGKPARVGSKLFSTKKMEREEEKKSTKEDNIVDLSSEGITRKADFPENSLDFDDEDDFPAGENNSKTLNR